MMAARQQSLSNSGAELQDNESSDGDSHHGSPKRNRSPSGQSIWPQESYRTVYLDVHAPSWVIQFPLVTECIEAAEEILGGVSRFNDDKYHVADFAHNVLKDVMRKGVVESNHRSWSDNVKVALLECCIALSSACAKGLASLDEGETDLWSPSHNLTQVRRSDVVAEMLEALAWTFELKSSFAETFPRGYRIPPECMEKVHHSVSLVPPQYPAWTRAIAAIFQEERGIQLIFEAIHKLDFEFQLTDSYLQPLCAGRWLLAHLASQGDFEGVTWHPVVVMAAVLENMEVHFDPTLAPTDADLNIVPSMLRQIHLIVAAAGGCATVYHTITEVRIQFFSVLLAKRSFSLTLVLIQDINNLFSQSFAQGAGSDPLIDLKPYLDWMSNQKVLQQLLGVNMHQRQYVDAVQKLLENMARLHALDTQTTLKLVESMLQEGVMDVEKDNIARVLKRVVKVADPSVVLGVLESTDLAAMKTSSDVAIVSYLLQQMIQNAKGEDVLQKCLAKTWQALLTSGRAHLMIHPSRGNTASPVDNMFSWLCAMADRECEARHSPAATPKFSKHYISCCFECLQKGEHLEVVLHTLHALLRENKQYIVKQDPMDQSFIDPEKAVEDFAEALCVWLEKEVNAGAPRDDSCESIDSNNSSRGPPASFSVTFRRFLDLIRFSVIELQLDDEKAPEIRLTAHLTAKLWHSTVRKLPPDTPASEVETSLSFFEAMCDHEVIDYPALCDLLNDSECLRPARNLTVRSLEVLHDVLLFANEFQDTITMIHDTREGTLESSCDYAVAPGQGHVIGMDYVFMVLIDAKDDMVARKAANMLVKLYIKPYSDFATCWPSWTGFVKDVLQRLCEYAYMYSSGTQSTPSSFTTSDWQKLTAATPENNNPSEARSSDGRSQLCRSVCRCMWLVQTILDSVHGNHKPALLPHHASAKGSPVELTVVLQNGLVEADGDRLTPGMVVDKSQRVLTLSAHSLMYIGDLRQIVGRVCGCTPLLYGAGQRLVNDSLQLCGAGRLEEQSDGRYKLQVHALPPNGTAPPEYPPSDLLQTAPDIKMAGDRNLIYMLLHLVDAPNTTSEVHRLAYKALIRLRTWPEISRSLKDCCGELAPGAISDTTKQLFFIPVGHGPAVRPQPAALMYTFEALLALMEPADHQDRLAAAQDQAADNSQLRAASSERPASLELFSCPNTAVQIIIQAAQANYTAARKDKHFWLLYHHTVINLLKWIVSHSVTPDSTELSHSAADSSKAGQDNSDAGKSPESSEQVDRVTVSKGAEDAGGKAGTANTTVRESSSSSDRANAILVPASCGTLQMSTLEALLDFWILLATRLSNGLAASSGDGLKLSWHMTAMELSESRLLDEVMHRIADLIQTQQTLLDSMLFGDSFMSMAEQLFFMSEDETFRQAMRALLCKCVDSASPAARCHLLKAMTSADTAKLISTSAGSNLQYYMSLTHIILQLTDAPHEECVPTLQQLLLDELDLLRETKHTKPSEQQLTGHLIFLTSLWRFFIEHPPQGTGGVASAMRNTDNVSLLIDHLLFPEAQTLAKIRQSGLAGVCIELNKEFQPICSSQDARNAAYKLLQAAVSHSTDSMQFCLHRFLEMLEPGPQSHALLKQQYTEHVCRSSTGEDTTLQCKRYRGLQNAGATCYMNAIFQQLYMQPTIRALVLKSSVPGEKLEENVFFQVQRMFAHLAFSHARSFTPDGIWKSMKDLEGQPINVLEHQDAHEFLYQLHEIIDGCGQAGRPETKPMFAAMGGTSVQSIRCQTVDYESRKVEEFTHISVDVQSMHNLQRALDVYFQEELMEGDNAYHCDKVDAKVPAIKRTLLEKLPHTFVVQLKRFEFDFANGLRLKIQDRFEFPTQLDLRKYTDAAQSETSTALPASYFEYELKGIVVHTGNAFAGHYFSFVKERGQHGKWLCMDDTSVTLWNPETIEECCFGGVAAGGQVRPNSAYMLVYERQDILEPIDVREELQANKDVQHLTHVSDGTPQGGTAQAAVAACQLGVNHNDAEGDALASAQHHSGNPSGEQRLSQYVQHAVVPYGLPWVLHAEVMQQNMLMAHASHWTATPHMLFLKDVVAECLDITQCSAGHCQQLRRSVASGSNSGLKSMSCDSRETTPSKRFAADRGLGSVPIPLTLSGTPGESKEELATQLSLKYCLSVLNYLPDADEDLLGFFLESAVEGMRSFALESCVDLVYDNLLWRLPTLTTSGFFNAECSALHPDRKLRSMFAETLMRVVQAAKPELAQGNLCCKAPDSGTLVRKVYRLLDLVWRIFKDYFTTKMVMLVDCLMESMAELADDIVVRCIIDQTLVGPDLPHPVHLLIISLPQILCNNFDSPHTTRASTCFWKLMRNMLFSQAQPHAQMGSLERIALRSYLRAASDIADEDQFLAANAPDGQQLTISLISLLVKNGVLHRVVDIIWYTAPKNFEKVHEFWMGPYLAVSRARPDQCQVLLIPVLQSMHEVMNAEDDDTEAFDRANFLMFYLVLQQMDAGRHLRLKIAFTAGLEPRNPNTRVANPGLYLLLERALELWRTQPGYRVPVQRMCRLLGQCVMHLHNFRPQDFQYILPSPGHCQRVMALVNTSYNTILQAGTGQVGRMQEPLSNLYTTLNHAQTQQGEVSDGSHCEQSPGGSAEEE